ncbi:unnamed protein product [Symbiodinium pilosum]|uniref:Uncharacterized protein n=1 Tax=Symbiodinium pilosum TaxID=2952 RepID=A0A812Q9M3_SYMPI|nr:unnamed protein product [Symbiodinium pilosum]
MVGNGKYKGKTFETLYADKSYVTWLVDHMAKEGKIEEVATPAKDKTATVRDKKGASGSAESPSRVKRQVNSKGKSTDHLLQDEVMQDEKEMSEWTRVEEHEAIQAEVVNLGQRMAVIEGALQTIIGEIQKGKRP